uniref:Uncharacterized protein n=1 Tax=Panicum mosaic virus satellite RNA satS TaxID=2019554 RepID=A0A221C667_SPMV|nr:hypothetical protein [Panicum mosaic virus satellite RNA satS]
MVTSDPVVSNWTASELQHLLAHNTTRGEARALAVDASLSSGCRLRGGLQWMPTDRPSSGQY